MKARLFMLAVVVPWISAAACMASPLSMSQEKIPYPSPHAVVLVHGYKDNSQKMQMMAAYLRKQGFVVFTPTLAPSWGQVGLDELARQLSTYIDANIRPGEKFSLVGFSMGGLVCRYYLQRMDGMRRVDRFITLGTPNHGTVWALLAFNTGCRQMRPGSDFLNDLNSDIGMLDKIEYTSIWTPLDLMIIPSSSSQTQIGRNIQIWVPIHPLLVWSPQCIKTVAGLLKS